MHKKRAPAFAGASFILTVTDRFFGQIDAKTFGIYRFSCYVANGSISMTDSSINRFKPKILGRYLYKNVFLNDSVILRNFILRIGR